MASLEEIKKERLKKISLLKEAGINPYPAKNEVNFSLAEIISNFVQLSESSQVVTLGGRIMALRTQGAIIFLDLYDGTANLQGMLKKDDLGDKFDLFVETIDIGDFVQITGHIFETNRGEKTIQSNSWKILAKSLRPLPDKWAGLQDTEEKLRRRYLDILLNQEVKEMVIKRSKFWRSLRDFLLNKDFIEVETPVLENTPGGADARPFITHHNALDMDVYLRISAGELWQKRLMVAGLPKVFEIGRIFRNEGISSEHLQDYTQLEFYWSYADYEKGMILIKDLYRQVALDTFGTTKFKIKDFEIDLADEWEVYDYLEIIKKEIGLDVMSVSLEELSTKLKALKIDFDDNGFNRTRAIDSFWKYCRKKIAGPGFLINVPVEMEPLAKRKADNPNLVERFQVILAGSEMGKGFSELNDPIDQYNRFVDQVKLREAGDEEAQMKDDEFVEALEYGMPPTFGFGLSERLFAFLSDLPVREAQIFPLMRPKSESDNPEK